MVAAAKGQQQSAASLSLDLAKFYEHVGHDHLWEEGRKTSFSTRLLACWCASYEGWRFLEADKCATFPFWAFGTILPGCSGATTAAKLMLATLLETVATRLPTYRLWNVVDDISGHVAGTPKMVQVLTAEAVRLVVEGLQARGLPLSKGKSKVLIDGPDNLKQALLQQLEVLEIDESDTARNVGADLQLGRWRRALVVKGRLGREAKRTMRVRQLRKAGRHTRKLALTGSNAGVLWGSEVLGFTPTQLQSIRVDAAKATYRLSRGWCFAVLWKSAWDMLFRIAVPLWTGGGRRERQRVLVFVMVADEILGGLRPSWERRIFAWTCDAVSLSFLGYADDVLLFSGSKASLETMIEDCCTKFGEAGLEVGLDKTHWSSSVATDGETLAVRGQNIVGM